MRNDDTVFERNVVVQLEVREFPPGMPPSYVGNAQKALFRPAATLCNIKLTAAQDKEGKSTPAPKIVKLISIPHRSKKSCHIALEYAAQMKTALGQGSNAGTLCSLFVGLGHMPIGSD